MTRKMTDAQLAYERKRAAKANKSLDEWLKIKAKEGAKTATTKTEPPGKAKKPGLFTRLVERGRKPL
ncbi:MAG: hypothetical protein PHT60_06225 [Acidiphilium sp.]|nr:hypothetical protein [Acidiphilium sp.]MDD4935361.1 hypothetical protein [Acidiphilium sp.]